MIIKLSVTHSFIGPQIGFRPVQNPYDLYVNSEYVVRFTKGTATFTKVYLSDGSTYGVGESEAHIFNILNSIPDRSKVAL